MCYFANLSKTGQFVLGSRPVCSLVKRLQHLCGFCTDTYYTLKHFCKPSRLHWQWHSDVQAGQRLPNSLDFQLILHPKGPTGNEEKPRHPLTNAVVTETPRCPQKGHFGKQLWDGKAVFPSVKRLRGSIRHMVLCLIEN